VAASGVTGLSVVLLPWYALDAYEPNGWDATWWARAALVAAVLTILALRFDRPRLATLTAALALALIAIRVASPPDFGFAFDGLKVPVERLAGCWVALGSSLLALLASSRLAFAGPEAAGPPQAPPSAAAAP
jgi:hypothetical protein